MLAVAISQFEVVISRDAPLLLMSNSRFTDENLRSGQNMTALSSGVDTDMIAPPAHSHSPVVLLGVTVRTRH